MNLYYKIWVDAIVKLRSRPQNAGIWKYFAMAFMSMAMSLNFMFLMAILQRNVIKTDFYSLDINIFPGTILNSFTSFLILFLSPMIILNYFLIFYRDRYETLIKKYKYSNGKLFLTYFLLSLIAPLLILYIGMFVVRL